jgi:hypothetical protein
VISVEIKSGDTLNSSFFANLRKLRGDAPDHIAGEVFVYGSESAFFVLASG